MLSAFLLAAITTASSFATPKPQVFCESIDRNFAPRFEVSLYQFDPTFKDRYFLVIETIADLAGEKRENLRTEGTATRRGSDFRILFETDGSAEGSISIRRLPNGFLKGEMSLGEQVGIELSCRQ